MRARARRRTFTRPPRRSSPTWRWSPQHTHNIRTYTVEGDLGTIPALAEGMGLNVTLGAWLDRHPDANAAELAKVVQVANANPDVKQIMVGNETMLRGDMTVPELIARHRRR